MSTVAQLIAHLQTQPQDMLVTVDCHSESVLLEIDKVAQHQACPPRPDGWVANYRKDTPHQTYLNIGV